MPLPNKIAVLIPCCNEEATIAKVIEDFRGQLPQAIIYVFDNCSIDRSAEIAAAHGAVVVHEPRQGKGFVIERMFDSIDADIYVMVDGDDTYPADHVHRLIEPVVAHRADMVVGARVQDGAAEAFRPMHAVGNKLVTHLVNWVSHGCLSDIMSGYRAFSRRVVDRLPVVSAGFEVETEMTVQMLYYRMEIVEVPVPYRRRPDGSVSKLRTFRDGIRVLWKIFTLMRSFKPLTFFGAIGLFLFGAGVLAGIPPIHDYLTMGKVLRFPLAILASGLMILAAGNVFLGILLHAMNWRLREMHNVMCRRR